MHHDDRRFLALCLIIAAAVAALILGVGYASGWDSGNSDVECVAIGTNPCVPVSK